MYLSLINYWYHSYISWFTRSFTRSINLCFLYDSIFLSTFLDIVVLICFIGDHKADVIVMRFIIVDVG